MYRGMKWFLAGAIVAAVAIAGGSWQVQRERQRVEQERQELAQVAKENEELARRNAELAAEAVRLEEERRQLGEIVERLSLEDRVAEVEVLEQHRNDRGRVTQTIIQLHEIDRQGDPLPPRTFGVAGDTPHFDALVVKFDDEYVAHGDTLRGRSISLFRRVYGETQTPDEGYWIGQRGDVPDIFRVNPNPTDFEQRLWSEFWSYATNPAKAREAGVRVAQGEAVYAPMKPGERWRLTLESDGGLNLTKQMPEQVDIGSNGQASADANSSAVAKRP